MFGRSNKPITTLSHNILSKDIVVHKQEAEAYNSHLDTKD